MPNWGEPSGSKGSFSDSDDSTDETWVKKETWAKPFQYIPRLHGTSPPREDPNTCSCGKLLVLRHRKSDNHPFLGCSTFPKCRVTFRATGNWPGNPQFWPDFPDDQEDGWRNWGDL